MTTTVPVDTRTGKATENNITAAREPQTVRAGRARVTFLRGSDIEVVLEYGEDGYAFTDEQSAVELYRCLGAVFGPLGPTRRAVLASVALADEPDPVHPLRIDDCVDGCPLPPYVEGIAVLSPLRPKAA
jgi:hypothetical protein